MSMSGTAVALQGRNTVHSNDIVNGQVKTIDVAGGAITTGKIGPGEVTNADIAASAVDGSKVENRSLTGAEVFDETIGGIDVDTVGGGAIDESTLGIVDEAVVAGTGRSAQGFACDPESTAYAPCASVLFTLPANGRVFIHGYGNGRTEVDSDQGYGDCAIYTSATGGLPETVRINADDTSGGEFAISTVTGAIGPGAVTFRIDCNQVAPGAIRYRNVGLSVVQIGPS